jgi:hypothetical protein
LGVLRLLYQLTRFFVYCFFAILNCGLTRSGKFVLALFGAGFLPDHLVQLVLQFQQLFMLGKEDGHGHGFEDHQVAGAAG